MRFSTLAGTFALCATAQAFPDTSPFILSSTASLDMPATTDQLQSNTHVLKTAKELLSTCPTDKYVVISQPKLHSQDLASASSSPTLHEIVKGSVIKSTYSVAGMYGEIASEDVLTYIRAACGSRYDRGEISISSLPLQALPLDTASTDERDEALLSNDRIIADVLATAPLGNSYTILYLSDVRDLKYEAQFETAFSSDLKRDEASAHRANASADHRPFFEKYELFNAGIYMALVATSFLLMILFVGLKALGSLEVSVGAFDKDMGPSAQKKQQ
ncbi:BIG1-domain-containing protein [Ceratocystis lukuohia]|uniref:Protein BIG1 n=1 Tax=Ceratocystis lukuohia TaxID=2019550 RepID=A0ABR4MK97_9PEZI